MNKFLLYALIFAAGIIVSFFLFKGCGDKKKPADNSTNNIEVIDDTLKVIQDYPRQIAEKEAVILDMQSAITELEKQSKKKGDLSDELANKVRKYQEEIKRLGGEILSLQFIVSEAKATATAPIEERPRTDEAGVEVAGDPVYFSEFKDSNEWYNAQVHFDLQTGQGSLNLVTRNEFAISDYVKDGVEYFRVENANPSSYTLPNTNLFKKPTPIPAKKKRFGVGVQAGYGINKDGVSPFIGLGLSYNLLRF